MTRNKNSKLTPTKVKVRLASGRTIQAVRHKNLVPPPAASTPPAGPTAVPVPITTPQLVPKPGSPGSRFIPAMGSLPLLAAHQAEQEFDPNSGIYGDGFITFVNRDGSTRNVWGNAGGGRRISRHESDDYGFTYDHLHINTGTRFDQDGFDYQGRTHDGADHGADGRDRNGIGADGRNRAGYGPDGRNAAGIHYVTGTPLDDRGFDAAGIHASTSTKFDPSGWDVNELRQYGQTQFQGKIYGEAYGYRLRGHEGSRRWANQPIQQAAWRKREGR